MYFSPSLKPSIFILVALTKILTFISQMHVKGSQRIKFRWQRGSQRPLMKSGPQSCGRGKCGEETHTYMKEPKHMLKTNSKGSCMHTDSDSYPERCRDKCANTEAHTQTTCRLSHLSRARHNTARLCAEVRPCFISGWGLNLLRRGPRFDIPPEAKLSPWHV